MSMTDRVLITGARAAAALDLARDFRRAGFEVHMADCTNARISRWSRVPAGFHTYAPPVGEPIRFRADIAGILRDVDPVLVIPTCEEVFHLAMPPLAAMLGERLFAPPLETLKSLHDKAAFAQSCAGLGLPIPETHRLTRDDHVHQYAGTSAEWVFKACFSRFGGGTRISPNPAALRRIRPTAEAPWIAQRRIFGEEVSFYAVAQAGRVVAFAAYGAKWRLAGGAGMSFDPVAPRAAANLAELAGRIADAFSITGQFACDAIIDAGGRPWLIECNPRATSGLHLLVDSGDLARAICDPDAPPAVARSGPRHLLPAMLTFGLVQAVTRRRLRLWWAQVRNGCDVAGVPGDRRPVAGALIDGIGFMAKGAMRGISTPAAATADIEWNGRDPSD
jgi:hypothetical protein